MKRLAIFGAGGHGKVVADIAALCAWASIIFYDDDLIKTVNGPWQVVGNFDQLLLDLDQFDGVFVALGNSRIRSDKSQVLKNAGAKIATIIHPFSYISPFSSVGIGSVVMAGTVINIASQIGEGCIINTGSTIDHDCQIGPYAHICPGAHLAGSVTVDSHTWIGIGSTVSQEIKIGSGVAVGAGAVVINDIADRLTVVGNPAKPLKTS